MSKHKNYSLVLDESAAHSDVMFTINCHICDATYLVGSRSISSFHNTSEGPIAYVTCPKGHHLVRSFRAGATGPSAVLEEAC